MIHEVVTPERVRIGYRVAGLGSRLLAWLIDMGLWGLLVFVGLVMSSVLEVGRSGTGMALFALWLFVLRWSYFLLFEWLWLGQTPGKRMMGIRVIQSNGTAIGLTQAALRNIVRVVDSLPLAYGLGFVVAAGDRAFRRLGDLAAGTLVVHLDHGAQPVRILADRPEPLERARVSLYRQRLGQLDREQQRVLLDLCQRRDQLPIEERTRLFQTVARFVQQRLDLGPAAYQSDEKFVLQLADVLGTAGGGSEKQPRRRERTPTTT